MRKTSRRLHFLLMAFLGCLSLAQDRPPAKPTLTVEWIMRDPKWLGNLPGDPYWSEDGRTVYLMWNPTNADADSLYQVSRRGEQPTKVPTAERQQLPSRVGRYARNYSKKVFERGKIVVCQIFSSKWKSGGEQTLIELGIVADLQALAVEKCAVAGHR